MKKNYIIPQQRVVELRSSLHILAESLSVNSVNGGSANLQYKGGASDVARSRGFDVDWDNE